jgi:hypothetical protein
MVASVDDLRTRFPEFVDDTMYSEDRIQLFLDDAILLYIGSDESRWLGKYNIVHCLLCAHLLTVGISTELGDTSANTGEIVSKTVGSVSVSRAIVPKNRSDMDNFFISTSYGQQFLNIRNTTFATVILGNV